MWLGRTACHFHPAAPIVTPVGIDVTQTPEQPGQYVELEGLLADRDVHVLRLCLDLSHPAPRPPPSVLLHVHTISLPFQAQLEKSKRDILQQRDELTKVVC